MSLHNGYLIVLSALFVVVFAIMLHSLAKHRRAQGAPSVRFSGPTGTVQWLWAMVPIAILVSIDFALIETPGRAQAIALAVAPPPTAGPADTGGAGHAAAETSTR